MSSIWQRIPAVIWSALLGLVISMFAGGVWAGLFVSNLKTSPAIPWAVIPMAFVLWLMWQYLGGKWWPRSTSEARRRYLRARPVSKRTFGWALLAGVLSVAALAGYWICMFQLVSMRANTLPDTSKYPLLTLALFIIMGSLVSPISEEAGFRGYGQVILERHFHGPVAIGIGSIFFALAHAPTQGWLWPKLLVYYLGGLFLGTTAYLTRSILPGIAVHILADLTFFAFVWPYDAGRRLVTETGADGWFWLHAAQAIVFTVLAVWAYRRLARNTCDARTPEQELKVTPKDLP